MQITINRSGGFAGLNEQIVNLDTASLSAHEAQQVGEQLKQLSFFTLPATIEPEEPGADYLQYTIHISDATKQHEVTFLDDDSKKAAPLVAFVKKLAAHK